MNQGAQSGGAYATVHFTDPQLITMDGKSARADQLKEEDSTQTSAGLHLRGVLGFVAYTLVAVHLACATCRARRDPWDLCFVLAAAAALALLLYCLGRFEALVNDAGGVDGVGGESRAARERRLRACVWALSTLLTVMFSARIAAMLPPPAGLVLAVVALAVAVGGFCLLFLCDTVHGDEDLGSGVILETCDGKVSENV